MQIPAAELFLAYRQAKAAIHQEQQSPWRLDWARAEKDLTNRLTRLRRHLDSPGGWFTAINLGRLWLLPKKAVPKATKTGITNIGGDYPARLKSLAVRPHLTPSMEFATVEVVWLWQFGAALEALLGNEARGNRLKLLDHRSEFNKNALGCFEFWPTAYQGFREEGFAIARGLLRKPRGRCLVATFDLTSYYDEVDATFLYSESFVDEVARKAAARAIAFDRDAYLKATRSLVGAFARYHSACERLTGIRPTRGIPIGCLTSKLISNVALASLDNYVRERPGLRYYARYVDDMLIVADASARSPATAERMARAFLPLRTSRAQKSKELRIDSVALGRPGSRFRLQNSKLRGYILQGRRGRDFLDTVERDVKMIASERRAFLLPDGLGTDSPLKALFVGSNSDAPVQVLREVDRLKVERYAASVAIGKVSIGVELLDPADAAKWCRQQLSPLAGHMTSPEQWLEFLDLALRAASACIRANDALTARYILRRHTVHLNRLSLTRPSSPITWNDRTVGWRRVSENLRKWYDQRLLEDVASSLPLSQITNKSVDQFIARLVGRSPRVKKTLSNSGALARHAALLFNADLRKVDRETDLHHLRDPRFMDIRRPWSRIARSLSIHPLTTHRADYIARFIAACRKISDPVYRSTSVVDLLLMTRPPTHFDIARRWSRAGRSLNELPEVTNAVRGTRHFGNTIRQPNARTIDITLPRWFGPSRVSDPQVVLGNLRTDLTWWSAAAEGNPVVTRHRMAAVGRIVNEAIRVRRWKKQPTLLVLPELSLPRRLFRALAHRLIHEEVSFIAGLEYAVTRSGVVNEAVGVFAPGYEAAAVCWWPKTLPARKEHADLLGMGKNFVTHKIFPMVVSTDFGAVSTLICSELLDVRLRGSLLGRIDLLVVPAWNQDGVTFDHTIRTAANDLHCFAAISNNAHFSDCRLHVPHEEHYLREVCRLISRDEDGIIAVSISPNALRTFQLASLADPQAEVGGFKPLPPGYRFNRP